MEGGQPTCSDKGRVSLIPLAQELNWEEMILTGPGPRLQGFRTFLWESVGFLIILDVVFLGPNTLWTLRSPVQKKLVSPHVWFL